MRTGEETPRQRSALALRLEAGDPGQQEDEWLGDVGADVLLNTSAA